MVGTKKFNEDDALDRAMEVFWRKGFDGASIEDLVQATGLQRGSLYSTFNNKETLYQRSLERYVETAMQPVLDALQHPDPAQAFNQWFDLMKKRALCKEGPKGCFCTQSAGENFADHPALEQTARQYVELLEDALYRVLQRAKKNGLLVDGASPRALARFLVVMAHGLSTIHRVEDKASYFQSTIKEAKRMLGFFESV
ncbi:TetR/AcrR family transcriptional regulator [bacterium]|nr:TetR/AcrR family transcriptional regulator [bacterium]